MIPVKITAVASFLAIGFTYFYTPVPDGAAGQDQWLLRKMYAYNQAGKIVSRLGSMMGYDTAINITRRYQEISSAAIVKDVFDIESEVSVFGGVPVTIHRKANLKKNERRRPAIFFIHGGNWIYRYRELYAVMERHLAYHLDVVVVSVDYRLAPEHPYPAGLNDCVTALRHLHVNAPKLGVNPDHISIIGDSAGGNLAAAVTLKLRDAGESFVYRQILISPITQFATFRMEAFTDNDKYGILTKRTVIQSWLMYLNESLQYVNELYANEHVSEKVAHHKAWPYMQRYQTFLQNHVKIDEKVSTRLEEKLLDPYLCPMMADSLKGLPPALILLSEYDVVRDDALAYADRLNADDVETVVHRSKGFHGVYCLLGQSVSGVEMVQTVVDYLRNPYVAGTASVSQKSL